MGISAAVTGAVSSLVKNPKLVEQFSKADALFEDVAKEKGVSSPKCVVETSLNGGVSPNVSVALAGANNGVNIAFQLTYSELYTPLSIIHIDSLSNMGGQEGPVKYLEDQLNKVIRRMARQSAKYFYRDSTGSLGAIATVNANDVILTRFSDVDNVNIGDEIEFHTAAAGGALRDSGDTLTVSAKDRETGKITFSTATSNISGLVAGDHIGLKGSRNAAPVGLLDWITDGTPGALYGITRSSYEKRCVAGTYTDQSSATTMYDAFNDGISKILEAGEFEGEKRKAVCHPNTWRQLSASMTSLEVDRVPKNYAKGSSEGGHAALYWLQDGIDVEICSSVHAREDLVYVVNPAKEALRFFYMGDTEGSKDQMFSFIEHGRGDIFTPDYTGAQAKLIAMMCSYTTMEMGAPSHHGIIQVA